MREMLAEVKELSKERYMWVIFCVLGVFLLPEYGAPLAVVAAILIARKEAKRQGRPLFLFGETARRSAFFVMGLLLTVTYSAHPLYTAGTALMWVWMFLAYAALLAVITDKERLCRLFQALTLCFGLLGLIGCIEFVGCSYLGWSTKMLQFWNFLDEPLLRAFFPIPVRLYSAGIRVAATYTNPNIFATSMLFLMPLSVYCIKSARHIASRVLFSLCLAVGVLGTAFSFCRTSYICIVGLLFLFVLYLLPRVKRPWGVVIALGAVAFVALVALTPNIFSERMQTLTDSDASVAEHSELWGVALSYIAKSPVLGYGAGISTTTDIMLKNGLVGVPHAHSLYLQLLLEGGAILLMLFFLPVFNIVYTQGDTLFRRRRQPLLGFCVLAALFVLMAYGVVGYPMMTPKTVAIWWILFALSDISGAFYANQPLGKLIEKKEDTPHA